MRSNICLGSVQENSKGRAAGEGEAEAAATSPFVFWWSDGVLPPTTTFVMELANLTQGAPLACPACM